MTPLAFLAPVYAATSNRRFGGPYDRYIDRLNRDAALRLSSRCSGGPRTVWRHCKARRGSGLPAKDSVQTWARSTMTGQDPEISRAGGVSRTRSRGQHPHARRGVSTTVRWTSSVPCVDVGSSRSVRHCRRPLHRICTPSPRQTGT